MNCQEVNFMLDSRHESQIDSDTKRKIEQHLATCETCRDAWESFDAMAAMTIPKISEGLASRMAAVLADQQAPRRPRRARQSMVLGGVLIVGAAVAGSVALLIDEPLPNEAETVSGSTSTLESSEPQSADEPPTTTAGADEFEGSESPDGNIAEADGQAVPLDPYSLAVVVTPAAAAQPDAVFEECYGQMLENLSEVAGLNVIAGERVSAFSGLDLESADIARALGAGVFVELDMPSESISCQAAIVDSTTDRLLVEVGGIAVVPPGFSSERLQRSVSEFVARIEDKIFTSADATVAEAESVLLNTALSDSERVSAILRLRSGYAIPLPGVVSDPAKIALTQIVTTSSDNAARASALVALRGMTDHNLIEPLLYALGSDTDVAVRRSAAYALHYFVDEPRVRIALEQASENDPSSQRNEGCCIQTVREAAQRALLSDEAVIELTLREFMNDSPGTLADRERIRLLTTSPDGRAMFPYPLPDDVAQVVYDVGVRAAESELRRTTWTMLSHSRLNAEMTQVLVGDLMTHPSEDVQRAAAYTLAGQVSDRDVRDSVERALSADLSTEVRQTLISALEVLENDVP